MRGILVALSSVCNRQLFVVQDIMEPVSFTIGVVGLVGAFTACVDCFDFIRIGRNFGEDYEMYMVKLDIVRLRFTRWGETTGMTTENEEAAAAKLKSLLKDPDTEFSLVERTLGQILRLFESAAETSKLLAIKTSVMRNTTDRNTSDGPATMRHLHEVLRNLAIRRQKRSSVLQKTSWALYRKREFNTLIGNLTDLVSALVKLTPLQPQRDLCSQDLVELGNDRNVVMLDDVLNQPIVDDVVSLDENLQALVSRIIEERRGGTFVTVWKRNVVGPDAKIRQGDMVTLEYKGEVSSGGANHTVEDSHFAKGVTFHQGHSYG